MNVIAPALIGGTLLLSGGGPQAFASDGADERIEEILVVGARLPRPVQDVVGTVDVITRDALIEQIAVGAEDVVRYVPGVSVARADSRFGATEFTIRGLSGNRVTTLIDGVPVADQFDVGAFANAGQDYLIADAVSRIEILRGPASTLFGSDALGGVVAVVTRDPDEYLGAESLAATAAAAYSGADQARVMNGSIAGRSGALAGVLHASYLAAEQRDASGTSLEEPLDRDRGAAVLKLAYTLPGGNALRLKGETFDEQVSSRPEAVLGFGRQFRNTTFLAGDDRRTRRALQLEFAFAGPGGWVDAGRVIGYGQRSRTDQRTDERRDLLEPPVAIERRFNYRVDDVGLLLDLESGFDLAGVSHRLGWGASVRRSTVEELRDGLERNLDTGAVSSVLLGETLPVRDFPNSKVLEAAVYLHDEVSLGPVTVIPGVRLEHYRLDADVDAVFREDFPTTPAVDVSESALAPRLGLQWRLAPGVDLFAQYAHGFRAPPFEDVNIGLDFSVPFNVRAIANPDLRSETSDGLELGLKYRGDAIGFTATLFGADYDDFIESKASLGFDPASGALLFQSRNIERARIYGAELSVVARLTPSLDLQAAASWTRGENRVTDEPLNTVDPPSLMTRLIWQPTARWQGTLALRAAAAQNRVDDSAATLFEPDGYALLDVTVGYAPNDRVRVNLGVFNVADQTYWHWASVRGRPEGDPLVDLLAGPGRYGALSLRVDL
ncbi:MAG: TonB-dependent receptor [Pseudomonadales bacterium]